MLNGFETAGAIVRPMVLMTVQAPAGDIERILAAVTALTPLSMGAYDGNAFLTAPGTERYRPLKGAAAGAEASVRHRPGVVEVGFELPDDSALLERAVEAVFQAHSYQEPVIRLQPILSSRSKGHDDRDNPNRWWNTTGDWKQPDPKP